MSEMESHRDQFIAILDHIGFTLDDDIYMLCDIKDEKLNLLEIIHGNEIGILLNGLDYHYIGEKQ